LAAIGKGATKTGNVDAGVFLPIVSPFGKTNAGYDGFHKVMPVTQAVLLRDVSSKRKDKGKFGNKDQKREQSAPD